MPFGSGFMPPANTQQVTTDWIFPLPSASARGSLSPLPGLGDKILHHTHPLLSAYGGGAAGGAIPRAGLTGPAGLE